ncbi:MAG: hypothetical protein ACI9Y1_001085, partial [Lentisphaeria bacterium]
AFLILFGLVACGPEQTSKTSTSESEIAASEALESASNKSEISVFVAWLDEKYNEEIQFSPIQMTFLGKKEKYDEIDDMSEDAERKFLEWKLASVEALKAKFDYDTLSEMDRISYDLWIHQGERAKEAFSFTNQSYIFHQMSGVHSFLPQFLISFHKVDDVSDMQAYVKRIGGVGRAITQLLARAQRYASNGVRSPRFAYDAVISESTTLVSGMPFEQSETASPIWADAQAKIEALKSGGKISDEEAQSLLAEVSAHLNDALLPAYSSLITWLKKDIDNTDKIAIGVGKREGGLAYYDFKLRSTTTTDLSANDIHEIGLKEVDRLTQEMEEIKRNVDFTGSLKDFFTFIKTDDRFFYPNDDDGRHAYITDTQAFLGHIHDILPQYFGLQPKAELVVRRVEAFREQDGAAQHYYAGTPDGSRPGIYYAHLSDMLAMPKNEMEAIAYHEGLPGHHMQISIAQELQGVPEFRKQASFTVYAEGWALYAETLAKEMGGYQNDYNNFGRLITEMWRAVRLVVDTGLHAKGWTEQQAVDYFIETTPIAETAVKSEVQRYLVIPGQATAYKIGMLKILELRKKARSKLGDKFDIRGFHDAILGGGAVPLNVLEHQVDMWISKVNKN